LRAAARVDRPPAQLPADLAHRIGTRTAASGSGARGYAATTSPLA